MSVNCKATISDDMKSIISLFQEEIAHINVKHESARVEVICERYLQKFPDLAFVGGWGTPLGTLEEIGSLNKKADKPKEKKEKQSHGGKRKGAGRKKGLPSEGVRLVSALAVECKQISDYYKTCTDEERGELGHSLREWLRDAKQANKKKGD